MSSKSRKRDRSAGFTLIEVLVALTIAAIMAIAITRFVAGTRWNASRIGEALEMTALSETLLGRVPVGQSWSPGRTDGRAGEYAWRVEVTPIGMQAIARIRAKKEEKPDAEKAGDAGKNRKMLSTFELERSGLADPRKKAPGVVEESMRKMALYRVAVTILAPSGRRYAMETIRTGDGERAQQ